MDSAALAHIVRAAADEAWDDSRRHLDATDDAARFSSEGVRLNSVMAPAALTVESYNH